MKRIVLLGSTGSIGVNTLNVVRRYPRQFKVEGLTAFHNIDLLYSQIKEFRPKYVAVSKGKIEPLRRLLGKIKINLLSVEEDLASIVAMKSVDTVVIGMRGSAALEPFLAAVRQGKTVAPANKEALVIAGDIIMSEARKYKATVIPIDSEQSAIFQCLEKGNGQEVKKVYLTASGGALLNTPKSRFAHLTTAHILKHPRWKMGKKITVDSATLMNKGFEVIEALRLFALRVEQVQVVIHPEAIIHSMVEFADGSIIAQLGVTDMRIPIQYALTHPQRWDVGLKSLDFFKLKELTFQKPDLKKFPSLALAMHVAKRGGTLPAVLNAADEEAVEAFLTGNITFVDIYKIVEKVVKKHIIVERPRIKDILLADQWAREEAQAIIKD